MKEAPRQIDLDEWDARHARLHGAGLVEAAYGGPLSRHLADDNLRLRELRFDSSPAALRLWNFILTEEERLSQARAAGRPLVGTMKDLGTVPVIAYSSSRLVAFCPDGAFWLPCLMASCEDLLPFADALGIDESFCPVRAVLGAFVGKAHFPLPDLLTCSVGATCDDLSAIAQRLASLGQRILWWEIPPRRRPDDDEPGLPLPGGLSAPASLVAFVAGELERVRAGLEQLAGERLDDGALRAGIREANRVRRTLDELRRLVFGAERCPLPALELMLAEMLALHFCSDRAESLVVLHDLLDEVKRRVRAGAGLLSRRAARVYWINPVADLRVMNIIEECGGRIVGTDYMFSHALHEIPEELPPLEALARMALADPMVGPSSERAARISAEAQRLEVEALVISRIPGASHCASEGRIIAEEIEARLGLPAVEIEVPSIADALLPTLRNRLDALVELALDRRQR